MITDTASAHESGAAAAGVDGHRYPGVRAFEEEDWPRFFGRSRAAEELLLRVLSVRLLLQFAPSGVGKTSLLNAGLFPRLRQHGCFPFTVRLNESKESVTEAVARSLRSAAERAGLNRPLIPDHAPGLWELLSGIQLWTRNLTLLTPVLVFDQFEEVFTLRDDAFRQAFAREVGELTIGRVPQRLIDQGGQAADGPIPDAKIIISLREEYLGKLEQFSASIPDLFRERLRLPPLAAKEAAEAIVKPARLEDGGWSSPAFEFEPACLDGLIDFIDGASDHFKVIEPLTLQLVCQQAEAIAAKRVSSEDRPTLTLADFGGLAGLQRLVSNYFNTELDQLGGPRIRTNALQMFELGLLDPTGKRLMLEQDEIERHYNVDSSVLNTLVARSLLRREPRNESVFYEISHDRLAEAIAKDRRPALPRWVKPTLAAGVMVIVLLSAAALRMSHLQRQATTARTQAEDALNVMLGEGLVARLREAGLVDALQHMLERARIDPSSESPALALSLRHQGDILRTRGKLREAQQQLQNSLAVLDKVPGAAGVNALPDLTAERSRTLRSLGHVFESAGEVSEALRHYEQAVELWKRVLKSRSNSQETLDAADARISAGLMKDRMGDSEAAEQDFGTALQLASSVLTAAQDRAQADHPEVFFDQGRAMQLYADAALSLANVWHGVDEQQAAYKLASEALRLRPLSSPARVQLGTASAIFGSVSDATPTSPADVFLESKRQFEELIQSDPTNRLLQRDWAASQLVVAEWTVNCAVGDCRKTLRPGALENAEIATFDSLGRFEMLSGLDGENRSWKQDVAWGVWVRAKLMSALGRHDVALGLFDSAVAKMRASINDPHDVRALLWVDQLLRAKAQLLDQIGRRQEALAAIDEGIAVLDRLPPQLPLVMFDRADTLDTRARVLKGIGRLDEATRASKERDQLRERLGNPWDKRKNAASEAHAEGVKIQYEAAKLTGAPAGEAFRRAIQKHELAIAEYPFDYSYWRDLHTASESTASIESSFEESVARTTSQASGAASPQEQRQGAVHADAREAALRGALTAAWLARVLSPRAEEADAWQQLYVARRSLAMFLRDHERVQEVLPIVEQGKLDAEEYARRQPDSSDALFLLADANVGLSMLRSESGNDGWEAAMRKGLAYGERLAKKEPASSERHYWLGSFRVDLGNRLRKDHREAAESEYKLGLASCRQALAVAARDAQTDRSKVESCLADLAALGYK